MLFKAPVFAVIMDLREGVFGRALSKVGRR
jgi:hypothetical protein